MQEVAGDIAGGGVHSDRRAGQERAADERGDAARPLGAIGKESMVVREAAGEGGGAARGVELLEVQDVRVLISKEFKQGIKACGEVADVEREAEEVGERRRRRGGGRGRQGGRRREGAAAGAAGRDLSGGRGGAGGGRSGGRRRQSGVAGH